MKSPKVKVLETKCNEVVSLTSEPKDMLSNYIAKDLKRSWMEEFVDQDTGLVVPIERYECLFPKGTLITQDVSAKIQFYIRSGEISEVAITNQQRGGCEVVNRYRLWLAGIVLNSDKRFKILLYANSLNMAYNILTDFAELQYKGIFYIQSLKEMDYITLINDDINTEDGQELKYYQLDIKIIEDGDMVVEDTYIVHTIDTERALNCIEDYLIRECKKEQSFELMIETSKILPCSIHVPIEFTKVYADAIKVASKE